MNGKRSGFAGQWQPKEAKQIEGEITPRPTATPTAILEALAELPDVFRVSLPARIPNSPHAEDARGHKIRQSARNEDCDIRIEGVCNFNRETTVWSHYPGLAGGRGMGLKSLDFAGCYTCSACHDCVDFRSPTPEGMTRQDVMIRWHEAHLRSLVKLHTTGLI